MPELVATTPGLYPLPDWAKETLADLKGHQKHDLISGDEGPEISDTYDEIRAELITDQIEADLDLIVEGQARWDDMLVHPLAVHENVETRGIVRYYDNNNFYREPVITGELSESGDIARDLKSAADRTESLQAVIPGPYSLSDLATNEYFTDETALLDAIGNFLATEVQQFPEHEALMLLEPSLVVNPPGDGLDEMASDAIDTVARATDAEVIVQTYWGALDEKVHAHLLDATIDAVGYDFVTDPENNLSNVVEYGTADSVSLGLIDGQNTLVETPELVRERIEWFQNQTPSQTLEKIYVTSNTELFYLPVSKYKEKLAILGSVATSEPEVIQ